MGAGAPLLSRCVTATFAIVFAASVAAVLFASGIGGGLSFGPGLASALSFSAYGALALGGFPRVPIEDRVSWWVAVMVAHAAFGLLAAWLFAFIGALDLGTALAQAFGGFAPASLVSLIVSPAAALPFRPSLPVWRVPRPARDVWSPSGEPEPGPQALPGPGPVPARWVVPARPAVSPATHPSAAPPGAGEAELARGPVLRIAFARIADQLPPDLLTLPPARLAATLLAPGEVLVPLELVRPRLHEGAVAVPATVLDDQLPRGAVLASTPEARARWNALRLALPMDEVVAQLQAGTLQPETAVAAVETIDASTAPFTDDACAGSAGGPGDPASSGPAVAAALTERADGCPAGARTPSRRFRADEIEAVVACLAPAGPFATHGHDVDGLGHLLVLARDLAPDAVATAVRGLVDVLPPASGTPLVVSLVTDRAAVAVAAGEGGAIAAGAGQPGAPVALMEILVARAAAAIGLGPRWAPAQPPRRLHEVTAPPPLDLAAVGAAMGSFGAVAPAVLRDDERRLDVYVFRPSGTAPDTLGGLAAALDAALGGIGLGRPDVVSLRAAGCRTEVRWAPGRAAVLAASGAVTRPGLARRQAARAVAALEPSA